MRNQSFKEIAQKQGYIKAIFLLIVSCCLILILIPISIIGKMLMWFCFLIEGICSLVKKQLYIIYNKAERMK